MDFVDLAALTIHDVKNRLALVARRAEAGGDPETLRGVLESAAELTRLLAFYKAERGGLEPQIDARVPADVVAEVVAETGRQTALTVAAELSGAPVLGFYDESLVRMVLVDAVYNALRHARQRVVVGATQRDGWLVFYVRDDGPGYPPEMLAAPAEMRPLGRHGTGLGLALAARVAAAHANAGLTGQTLLSNDGGAVFSLLLPA